MHTVSIEAGGIVPLPRAGGALSHTGGSIRNLHRHSQAGSPGQIFLLVRGYCRLHSEPIVGKPERIHFTTIRHRGGRPFREPKSGSIPSTPSI